MKTRFISLIALASGLAAAKASAQVTPPVLIVNITEIQVTNGHLDTNPLDILFTNFGSGYAGNPPQVNFSGGGGSGAQAVAVLDPSGNAVASLFWISAGSGYLSDPFVSFSGGGPSSGVTTPTQAEAQVTLAVSADFLTPNQNEGFGPAGDPIGIVALASGTEPAAGFTYQFTVNGLSVGESPKAEPPGTPSGILWTPPLPGVYSIITTTTDGNGNNATSPAVRYFATGTVIVSPEAGGSLTINAPGSLVPVGSTVVIQATSTSADGFIKNIAFYTDWNGVSGTLIGTATNYPYSVIYQPAGAAGVTHVIKAIATDDAGNIVPPAVLSTNPHQDEILLTMATANSGGLPTATIITPSSSSLIEIPNYAADSTAFIPVDVTAGAVNGASITRVELYVNGLLYATDSTYNGGYNFKWAPSAPGSYALLALAYDTSGNVVPSSSISTTSTTPVPGPDTVTIEAAPAVAITNPGGGATISTGGATIQAVAVDTNLDQNGHLIPVTQVQFFQDGVFVGAASAPTSGDLYQISFQPTQKVSNGNVVESQLTAVATDQDGFQGASEPVNVNVTSGGSSSNNVVIGTPPTVSLVSPMNHADVTVNSPVTLSATAAAPNGNIASVSFLVDNTILKTVTQYPYSITTTFGNLGTYQVSAVVTDNVGDKTTSAVANITVVTEAPPIVNITGPTPGGTVTTGSPVTVTASASSPQGTVASVQFFENGLPIGTATTAPYSVTFTPLSAGIYTFTAIATDSAGETTTTTPVIVEAFPVAAGLGTTAYFGQYQGLTDGGRFAFMVIDGTYGTYIGHSNASSGSPKLAFYSDIPVSAGGSLNAKTLNGIVSQTGVSGNLVPSNDLFIGAAVQSGSVAVAGGYYTGNIEGQAGSQVTGILGADGEFMVYISSGSFSDIADGSVDSTGALSITTANNNMLTGRVDPSTGFFTGTISGPASGPILAARVSGGIFSDGVLKNISTRGQVGSGSNVMIAGFVVGGTAPKQLLVRAIGPTLATFNLAGAITGTQLQVFSGSNLVNSNVGWSSSPTNSMAVSTADLQVGAFALPVGSGDSALVGTFAPGNYTAMVSGTNGATGIGLVEIYDLDPFTPFTSRKLTNVSTRGQVGTGNNVLIGGFSINGTAPKRVLIRGAGPGLTGLNVSGALAAPHLQLYNSSQSVIRENYSWGTGNDPGLVAQAQASTGAFAFAAGSADSAILIVLPPGTYTAEVSGANLTTGDALVEIYEVP
jgi:hypothetical protein